MTQKSVKPKADWEAIERDYRTTTLSLAEIARKHGDVVSGQRIGQKAKKDGWTRDLTDAVRHATNARVIQEEVRQRQEAGVSAELSSKVSKAFDETASAVEVAAELGAQVILRHRNDALRLRNLAVGMADELTVASTSQEELQELFNTATEGMSELQLIAVRSKFLELLRLHNRIGSAHKLADTLAKLQVLERKAFSLDDDESKSASGDDIWTALAKDKGGRG